MRQDRWIDRLDTLYRQIRLLAVISQINIQIIYDNILDKIDWIGLGQIRSGSLRFDGVRLDRWIDV